MNSLRLGVATWGVVSGSIFLVCVRITFVDPKADFEWNSNMFKGGWSLDCRFFWSYAFACNCSEIGADVSQTPSNGAQSKA